MDKMVDAWGGRIICRRCNGRYPNGWFSDWIVDECYFCQLRLDKRRKVW